MLPRRRRNRRWRKTRGIPCSPPPQHFPIAPIAQYLPPSILFRLPFQNLTSCACTIGLSWVNPLIDNRRKSRLGRCSLHLRRPPRRPMHVGSAETSGPGGWPSQPAGSSQQSSKRRDPNPKPKTKEEVGLMRLFPPPFPFLPYAGPCPLHLASAPSRLEERSVGAILAEAAAGAPEVHGDGPPVMVAMDGLELAGGAGGSNVADLDGGQARSERRR